MDTQHRLLQRLSTTVARWVDRKVISETLVIGVAAVLVGLLSGIGVWVFKLLIDHLQTLFFTNFANQVKTTASWLIILVPVAGGLIVGLIVHFFIGKEQYHGLPGIIAATALAGGRLPYRKLPVRTLAAVLSIGTGASVGPEDPSVQIGANIGSMIGQLLRLSEERMRALVAGGTAAGIAAAFNAPIAGVFFALEVLLGEISGSSFGFAAISAVTSAVFTQAVSGSQPAFTIPQYTFGSILELPLYLALGILAGPIAAVYIQLIFLSRRAFHRLTAPDWVKPAIAGLLVGITGLFLPQVFGVGYATIGLVLGNASIPVYLLFILLIAKLILTPISIGGGFVGGVFAPSLFLGAMLGGGFGVLAAQAFPGLGLTAPSFALVGMAAVLAGTVHAPLTAILLLFEMTHDYRIILPLMFAVAISLYISKYIQRDSVYNHSLALNGIRLEHGREVDVLEGLKVSEVITSDCGTLKESDTIESALEQFAQSRHHGLPVTDNRGNLVGMLTMNDVEDYQDQHPEAQNIRVGEICIQNLVTVTPNDTLSLALRKMGASDIGRLPVVELENPKHLIGMLRRSDIIRSYEIALARNASKRHHIHEARLGILSGVDSHDVTIQKGSTCVGKQIKDVTWPKSCVIASIRRGHRFLLPHGDTILKTDDVLVIVTEGDGIISVQELCQPGAFSSE
jgi:CIC family chloride channel protein